MTPASPARSFIEKQLDLVRPRFLGALSERLDRMERLRDVLAEDRCRREPAAMMRADAHKTLGVAATLGYAELGELARRAEAALDACLATPADVPCSDKVTAAIDDLLGEMALIVEAARV